MHCIQYGCITNLCSLYVGNYCESIYRLLTRPTKKQWRSQHVFSRIAVGSCQSQQACMQYSEMGLQLFFRFSRAAGGGDAQHRLLAPAGITYAVCTCSPGRRHCNKLGVQATRRGMQFWPFLQHCSKSIALLGDCNNS